MKSIEIPIFFRVQSAQAVDPTKCPMPASPLKQRATSLDLVVRNAETTWIPREIDKGGLRMGLEDSPWLLFKKKTNLLEACEKVVILYCSVVHSFRTNDVLYTRFSSEQVLGPLEVSNALLLDRF